MDSSSLSDCTHIVHLAALPEIKNCEKYIKRAIIDNVVATYKVLDLGYRYNKPVVFASSGAAQDPKSSIYSITKNIGEEKAFQLNKVGGRNTVLRFANVYGVLIILKRSNQLFLVL